MKTVRILLALLISTFTFTCVVPSSPVFAQAQQQRKEITVYVTDTGKRYHRAECRYLRYSRREVSLKEAVDAGYTPCHVCKPPVLKQQSK
jgi:hypothetical protein